MMVLVDTSVWSLALRRIADGLSSEQRLVKDAFAELIRDGRTQLIGPVRQELLSGIREEAQFQRLRERLRAFDDVFLMREDYEEAAAVNNRCRSRGIVAAPTDALICAVAIRRNWKIFTTDRDFTRYAKIVGLDLYEPA